MSFQEFPAPYIISLSESYWIRWNVPKQKLQVLLLGKGWVWSNSSHLLLAVTHWLTLLLLFILRPKIKDMYNSSCVSSTLLRQSQQHAVSEFLATKLLLNIIMLRIFSQFQRCTLLNIQLHSHIFSNIINKHISIYMFYAHGYRVLNLKLTEKLTSAG